MGAIAATTNPKLLMVSHAGGLSTLNIKTGASKIFARPELDRDAVIYNDCKVDHFGRLWVGSSHAKESDPRGALWCVLPNGKCFLGDVGFAVSNGPAFSLDGKIMYFNDSVGKKTFAYDISPDDPMPRNRRVLISYTHEEGMPDGLTVDAEGNLWVAHWGGARITQFTNAGFRLRHVQVPAPHVTTVGFGGEKSCHPLRDNGARRDEPGCPAALAAVRRSFCTQTGGPRRSRTAFPAEKRLTAPGNWPNNQHFGGFYQLASNLHCKEARANQVQSWDNDGGGGKGCVKIC